MCDCISVINKKIQESEPNLRLDTATHWKRTTGKLTTVPRLNASKIDKSIRKGAKELTIYPTYCPFCGVKIELDKGGEND
jgi:hypothetical protein